MVRDWRRSAMLHAANAAQCDEHPVGWSPDRRMTLKLVMVPELCVLA